MSYLSKRTDVFAVGIRRSKLTAEAPPDGADADGVGNRGHVGICRCGIHSMVGAIPGDQRGPRRSADLFREFGGKY